MKEPSPSGPAGTAPSPAMHRRSIGRWCFGASVFCPIVLAMIATVCLVVPRCNFPLNDDWVYAKTIQRLLEEHRYVRHPFSHALAIGQTLWGALFAAVFGFNFVVLRASTLVLALVALWATARCALECGFSG